MTYAKKASSFVSRAMPLRRYITHPSLLPFPLKNVLIWKEIHTTTLDMRSRNWKIKRGLLAEVGCINDRYVKEEHCDFAEHGSTTIFLYSYSTHHAMPPIWPRWQTRHDSGSKEHPEVRKEWDVLSLRGARAPKKIVSRTTSNRSQNKGRPVYVISAERSRAILEEADMPMHDPWNSFDDWKKWQFRFIMRRTSAT